MEILRSKTNKLVKQAKKLHQKKYRKDSYLIEGWHLFEETLKAGATIEQIFVLEELAERVAGLENVKLVSREVLIDLADSQTPQGVVVQIALSQPALPPSLSGKYLFLEDVQDPGNVGTMIRTADAAGYDGVLVSDKSADIYSLKTLRSMQGSHFHLPIYRVATEEAVRFFKEAHLQILATTLSQNSISYREVSVKDNFVLVMGNEGQGISDFMSQQADLLVHIDMPGQAESLNVAVATGILLFSFL